MATVVRNRIRNQLAAAGASLIRTAADNPNDAISERLPRMYAVVAGTVTDGQSPRLLKAFVSRSVAVRLARRFNRSATLAGSGTRAEVFRIGCRISTLPNFTS
jgi:hypothetical protein